MFSSAVGTHYSNMAIAMPHSVSPYITVYNISPAIAGTQTSFTKLANPTSLPTSGGDYATGCAWDPSGRILMVTITNPSPQIAIYERTGDTLTKLPNPGAAFGQAFRGGSWHPNGNLFVAGIQAYPYISILERSATTSTRFVNLSTSSIFFNSLMPTGACRGAGWNPQGNILSIQQDTSPYIYNYWYDGTTFTRLAAPNVAPTGSGGDAGPTWSPDGNVLFYGHVTSPRITAWWVTYNGTATTFTKLANPASLPTNNVAGISINNTGSSLVMSVATSPYVEVYNISYNGTSTTMTKVSPALPAAAQGALGASWLPDDRSFVWGLYPSPYFTWYTRSGDTFTRQPTRPATLPAGNINGPLGIWPKYGAAQR